MDSLIPIIIIFIVLVLLVDKSKQIQSALKLLFITSMNFPPRFCFSHRIASLSLAGTSSFLYYSFGILETFLRLGCRQLPSLLITFVNVRNIGIEKNGNKKENVHLYSFIYLLFQFLSSSTMHREKMIWKSFYVY